MSGYANYSSIRGLCQTTLTVLQRTNNVEGWLNGVGHLVKKPEPIRKRDLVLFDGSQVNIDPTEATGSFRVYWDGNKSHAVNDGIGSQEYTVAVKDNGRIHTGEINHHPDSSQYFIPKHSYPYYLILGRQSTEPIDLVAIRLQNIGVHIYPGVWHQPPILTPSLGNIFGNFLTGQLRSRNCVNYRAMEDYEKLYSFKFDERNELPI